MPPTASDIKRREKAFLSNDSRYVSERSCPKCEGNVRYIATDKCIECLRHAAKLTSRVRIPRRTTRQFNVRIEQRYHDLMLTLQQAMGFATQGELIAFALYFLDKKAPVLDK